MNISISGDTDVGRKREHNEDAFIIFYDNNQLWQKSNNFNIDIIGSRGIVFAIADGMGGANAGEIASAIAMETLEEKVQEIKLIPENPEQAKKILASMILAAHSKIVKESKRNKETRGMGTTMVLGWVVKNILYIAWSGDSRCYHYRKGRDTQLIPFTEDHSLVWGRVQQGEITPEEARLSDDSNLILQALGDKLQTPVPDFKWTRLEKNDRVLLCSDGLNSMLSDIGIQQILDFESKTNDTCQSLIKATNNAGGLDNVTVILLDILEETEMVEQTVIGSRSGDKRWLKFSIGISLLIIIATGLFLAEMKYHYIGNLKSKIMSLDDSLKSDSLVMNDSLKQPDKNFIENPSLQNELPDKNKKKTSVIIIPKKQYTDSVTLIKLRSVMDSIKTIRAAIKKYELGTVDAAEDFYINNKTAFDAILFELDSLESKIEEFAEIKDNSSRLLKDVSIEFIHSAQRTIASLYDKKKSIEEEVKPADSQ